MNSVLFICTGNYYRSRMAEELFQFWAQSSNLAWQASSAGLRSDMSKSPNVGPISKYTLRLLRREGFPIQSAERFPRSITPEDLKIHDVLICMYRREHEPMFRKRFPDFEGEVLYWEVPDIQFMEPEKAYKIVKGEVQELISLLHESTSKHQ